jgi:hypothetical protein
MRDTRIYGTCRNDDNEPACEALGLATGTRPQWQSLCETPAYSAGTVLTLDVGGYQRTRGCATLHVVCVAVAGPGVGANAPQALEADEGPKITDEVESGSAVSTVAVAAVVVAIVVVIAGIIVSRRRLKQSPGDPELEGIDAALPDIVDAAGHDALTNPTHAIDSPTHFYPGGRSTVL